MSTQEAIAKLVEVRKVWRANGSTIQFNKDEGVVFNAFRQSNTDWETRWPEVQLAAHQQVL